MKYRGYARVTLVVDDDDDYLMLALPTRENKTINKKNMLYNVNALFTCSPELSKHIKRVSCIADPKLKLIVTI